MQQKASSYTGTSNIVLPGPKKNFPAEFVNRSRLSYYASLFNSVEINRTFYKLPMPSTVERWVSEVPDSFRFTFKLHRDITHVKNLAFKKADIAEFFDVINAAGAKKGCLLIQFPAGTTAANFPELAGLLDLISENDHRKSWQLAIEFRHSSWYKNETTRLLQEFSAIYVLHDIEKSAPPRSLFEMPGTKYFRSHGTEPNYRGTYTETQLEANAKTVSRSLVEGDKVYTYFNNTLGDAFNNTVSMQNLINSRP